MTQHDPFAVIRQWGDPALREKARPIDEFDTALAEQVAELKSVMLDADGAGLAATQVGVLRRVFVYQGLLIGVVGTGLGTVIGLLAATLLARYRFISLPGDVYFIDTLPVSIEPVNVALIVAASFVISLAATVYPATQAARMAPVEAIRYE